MRMACLSRSGCGLATSQNNGVGHFHHIPPEREGSRRKERMAQGGEEKRDPAPDALLMMAHEASWSRSCVRTASQASG